MEENQIQKEIDYSRSMSALCMIYGNKENEEYWDKRLMELENIN